MEMYVFSAVCVLQAVVMTGVILTSVKRMAEVL